MKVNIDTKKGKEALSKAFQKTSDISKKAVNDIQHGAKELSEKAKNESYLRRLKKYNPLFPDKYQSDTFNIPNMIMKDAELMFAKVQLAGLIMQTELKYCAFMTKRST